MSQKINHKLGFTLLELLLSVAIISVLAGFSLPVYRTLMMKNDLDIAGGTIASSLRRAQVHAQAVDGDTTWGVKVQSGGTVIFKGASFAVRDTTYDETFDMPTTINVSGVSEIVFAKLTGIPGTLGTINLSTESDNLSLSINEKGMVVY